MKTTIKSLRNGDFFTRKDYGEYPEERQVWIRGEYDRTEKKFECYKWDDVNHVSYLKGSREVYAGFTF